MATSGSTNFNRTCNEIIQDAFYTLNVYDPTQDIEAEDLNFARTVLNKLIKHLQNMGLNLWVISEATLFLEEGTNSYSLSDSASAAKAALTSDTVITQLSADAASAATSLTVDDTTDMAVSDNIGIVQDDGTIKWTTIATIPTSTTLTINSALTDDAASGNNVYTFTNRISRPLRILHARVALGTGTSQIEITMTSLSREEYLDIASKNVTSKPNSYFYDRQLAAGVLYLWPAPSDVSEYIRFTYERLIEDFDSASDDPDLPVQWQLALTYNLADLLGPTYNCVGPAYDKITLKAQQFLEEARDFDTEFQSIYLVPKRGR